MRIESTGSAAANAIPPSPSPASSTSASAATKSASASTTAIDPSTGQPVPPKYPWITRLTLELEQNAQKEKTSPFEAAKIVGETLNKVA